MATWAAIANAVQAAIVSGASLTAGAVRWRFQDSPQPALSFIDLSLGTSLEVGQPFVEPAREDFAAKEFRVFQDLAKERCIGLNACDRVLGKRAGEARDGLIAVASPRDEFAEHRISPAPPWYSQT